MIGTEHTKRKILRWEVHVDPAYSGTIKAPPIGDILHVAARSDSIVEFWAEVDIDGDPIEHAFTVVGDGHLIYGDSWEYVGTTQRTTAGFVWHLLRWQRS